MTGKTLIQALQDKYRPNESQQIKVFVPKGMPGMTDSGDLVIPNQLVLDRCSISEAGDVKEIENLCQDVCELDLAGNCISEWQEVFSILKATPKVSFLNLSNNPLRLSQSLPASDVPLLNIGRLVLNNTQITWEIVNHLLHTMPNLYELHLSLNNYTTVALDPNTSYSNVTSLHFNSNNIADWHHLCCLGKAFPKLENLVLVENPISEINLSTEDVVQSFPELKSINISKSKFTRWREIEKFCKMSCLQEIRMRGIPLLAKYEEKKGRQFAVAFLPTINLLNGSPILEEERADAERALIRHFMDKEQKPQRYHDLEKKHGALDQLVEIDLAPECYKSITVHMDDKVEMQRVYIKHTVAEFKRNLSEFAGMAPNKFKLFYNDVGGPYGHEELKLPNRPLHMLGVKDGDEFYLEKK